MRFQTVYYSQFFYSRFARLSPVHLDGDFAHSELERHRAYLRLLAVFFEIIYIPRTHLLTQLVPLQWEIPAKLFSHNDVAFLTEIGTLRISRFPGIDDESDNFRIAERAASTNAVTYATDSAYWQRIPRTADFVVESIKESQSNTVSFPEYGRFLEYASADIARKFREVAEQATLKDVPFFHESFIRELREKLTESEFEKIWRDTNSIYLTTGVPNRAGVIPYFNETIESTSFRYKPFGIDRFLFSPASLHTFLQLLLRQDEIDKLLHGPIEKVLTCLHPAGYGSWFRGAFRDSFFDLVASISSATAGLFTRPDLNQTTVREMFRMALDGDVQAKITGLEGALTDAAAIGASFDSTGGLISGLAGPAIRHGRAAIASFWRRKRHPDLYDFIDTLRTTLKQVT